MQLEFKALTGGDPLWYMKTSHWSKVRTKVFQRDKYSCKLCNGTKALQVHHRTYEFKGKERMEDLITLCDDCHEIFHLYYTCKHTHFEKE